MDRCVEALEAPPRLPRPALAAGAGSWVAGMTSWLTGKGRGSGLAIVGLAALAAVERDRWIWWFRCRPVDFSWQSIELRGFVKKGGSDGRCAGWQNFFTVQKDAFDGARRRALNLSYSTFKIRGIILWRRLILFKGAFMVPKSYRLS